MTDDIMKLMYLCGIATMGLTVHKSNLQHNMTPYLIGMTVCVGSILALHILYYFVIPTSKPYCQRRIFSYIFTLISIIIAIIIIYLNINHSLTITLIIVGIAVFNQLLMAVNSFRYSAHTLNFNTLYFF